MEDKKDKLDPKKLKGVSIIWEDATARAGWHEVDETSLVQILTLGYVVKETEGFITVATSVCSDGGLIASNTIPKGWIIKRKAVKL